MKVTNYVWFAQGELPMYRRISPTALQEKVNDNLKGKHVQVVSPATQLSPEAATALIRVDFNHELERDPNAIFVIRSDSIPDDFLRDFLATQTPLIELQTNSTPPRILLFELPEDETQEELLEMISARFSEATELGLIDIATSREELVRKVVRLVETMNR